MDKRNYECMMIIASNLGTDKQGELVKKFQKMASSDCTVERMGVRKFSVPINYRKEGMYVLLHFSATCEKVAEMTALMNITDGLERFMFIVKDEKMLAFDAKRRAQRAAARADQATPGSGRVSGEKTEKPDTAKSAAPKVEKPVTEKKPTAAKDEKPAAAPKKPATKTKE